MLYFIPTPIGNLEDISQRALNFLNQTSTILCEDTRVTKKLLSLFNEKYSLSITPKQFIPFHSHNEKEILNSLDIQSLQEQKYAYLSDAGMPCISDPGATLVRFCQKNSIEYEVLPGASAVLLTYVASGFYDTKFSFFGFLPHKGKERKSALQKALNHPLNVLLYESPYRILTLLEEIVKLDASREVFLIKEATKLHEKKFFGNAKDVLETLKNSNTKGEWALAIKNSSDQTHASSITQEDIISLDIPPKQKAKLLAKITQKKVSFWYEQLINN